MSGEAGGGHRYPDSAEEHQQLMQEWPDQDWPDPDCHDVSGVPYPDEGGVCKGNGECTC